MAKTSVPLEEQYRAVAKYNADIGKFKIRAKNFTYTPVPSLITSIHRMPLTKGIGHSGWLRVDVEQVSQKDIQKKSLYIWLVDALQNKHKVENKRKNDRHWDESFDIVQD